jgi:hypothetical protein
MHSWELPFGKQEVIRLASRGAEGDIVSRTMNQLVAIQILAVSKAVCLGAGGLLAG